MEENPVIYRGNGNRDNAVRIATRYGMDGSRIGSRWGRDFPHPSRPALGPEAAFEGGKWGDRPRPRSFDKKNPLSTNREKFFE